MGDSRIFRFYKTASMLVVALLSLAILLAAREGFWPMDWVEVTMRNVPKGLRQIYLIADRRDGVSPLNFYHSKILVGVVDPRDFGAGWSSTHREDERSAPLQWPRAHRYGVLAQRSDGTWELWWLGSADLDGPSISRYLVGGGKAEVRLPDESRAVAPSRELLKQVGLPDAPAWP